MENYDLHKYSLLSGFKYEESLHLPGVFDPLHSTCKFESIAASSELQTYKEKYPQKKLFLDVLYTSDLFNYCCKHSRLTTVEKKIKGCCC